MPNFQAKFDSKRFRLGLHRVGCCAAGKSKRHPSWVVEAIDAKRKLEDDEDAKARGLKVSVCKCIDERSKK